MMPHDRLDEEARDRAALYALGSIEPKEASLYEAHLAACSVCRREVDALREALSGVAGLAPAVLPPSHLKERLMKRIHENGAGSESSVQIWKKWSADGSGPGMTLILGGADTWEPTGVEGVEVKRLYVDAANDRATMLVRMQPGASYPTHRHAGTEECYVVEGDLLVGENRMRAGDYQRASGGSVHGDQSTEGGCLLLIVSSLHDELLEESRP